MFTVRLVRAGLLISMMVCAMAQAKYSGGNGTEADPYRIGKAEDLILLGNTSADYAYSFMLTADLDLAGFSFSAAVLAPDTSASGGFQGTAFEGTLAGDNHVIRNLTIAGAAKDYLGLVGYLNEGGRIQNLALENVTITARFYAGGLCGYNDAGALSQCNTAGSITGGSSMGTLGGLCGMNAGVISQCYAAVAVNGYINLGGLCGENSGAINQSYATGAVRGNWSLGGLCGGNLGTISQCYATGAVGGSFNTGGLCGWTAGGYVYGSFWDTQTSGQTTSAGGTGKMTSMMMTDSLFIQAGWDFSASDGDAADWVIPHPGESYPKLVTIYWLEAPYLIGLPKNQAFNTILAADFTLGILSYQFSAETPDTVLSQNPPAGGRNKPGTPIQIILAKAVKYSGGSGAVNDPYRIATASDLVELGQNTLDYGQRFILTEDINLAGYVFDKPVIAPSSRSSSGFEGPAFTGVLDGNNHAIRHLKITGADLLGLIGYLGSGGKVQNLGLESVQVNGKSYLGGLCGVNINGIINSCYSAGVITGGTPSYYVGGLCGYNNGVIQRCYASGAVKGAERSSEIGGLCGFSDSGSIHQCYAACAISSGSNSQFLGGLCGARYGTVSASFWDTQVSGMTASARGTGKTTAQMFVATTFTAAGWDFSDADGDVADWKIYWTGVDYPRLARQGLPGGDLIAGWGVDRADFNIFMQNWQTSLPSNADFAPPGGDGVVNLSDFARLSQNWKRK